ncbi:MAG: galactitol-1-phosphate 5-dehydrogenase [Angelakisella sp.]|nr:galactitol-1-phosphate 5-dehydrogenase [Angelakisella sp.]
MGKSLMKAAVLHKIGDFRTIDVKIPKPRGEELLIRIGACGICGSDIPRIFKLGTSRQQYPLIIGHEFSGVVEAVGEEADSSFIGKRGAFFPLIPCRRCDACLTGNYAMCSDYNYLGSRCDGGFAEYCLIPSAWHLVESHNPLISLEALSLTEPATVAQHAIRKSQLPMGGNIVIFGAGPIGILAARWATIFGASNILLVDISDEKIQLAEKCGFHAVNSKKSSVAEEIKKLTRGKLADTVIEGTGAGDALNECAQCVRPLGTITLLGNPHKNTEISLTSHSMLLRKEITLTSVWNSWFSSFPVNEWEVTVNLLDQGKLVVEDLITHRVNLDNLPQLCEDIYCGRVSICKAICTE